MKQFIFLVIILITLISCQQRSGFVINGKITNANEQPVFLKEFVSGGFTIVDSTIIRNDTFLLNGSVEYPDMFYLEIPGVSEPMGIFVENTEMTITADAFDMRNMVVTGSQSQADFQKYMKAVEPFSMQMDSLFQEYPIAQQAGDEARMNELYEIFTEVDKNLTEAGIAFIQTNPASYASVGIMEHISNNMEPDELEDLVNSLDAKLMKHPKIETIVKRLENLKKTAIGQKAPDFTVNDTEGNPLKLSDKIGNGLLLIDFWAAWCRPCRDENPNVVAVYNKYKSQGFDVLGVSLDTDKQRWLDAIENDGLTWTQVSQLEGWNSNAAKQYAVSSIPANFLLDENGIIIAKNLRGDDLENKLKEILGN